MSRGSMNKYDNIYAVAIEEEAGLELSKKYKVKYIVMGQCHTAVLLEIYDTPYNSISFKFYEGDTEIDIYRDPRFNPYMKLREAKI